MLLDMNFYVLFLHLHSVLRWIALAVVVILVIKSIIGLTSKSAFGKLDNILGASFVGTMHLQFLLGLVLYFIFSPITETVFADFGAAMKNAELRFWAVEHVTIMILAIALAQIGRSKSKKAASDAKKFKTSLIFFGLSLALMLAGIPWGRI